MDKKTEDRKSDHSRSQGSLCIVGIGPGSLEHLTFKAKEALEKCDVVVGYKTYIDLIKSLIQGKEIFSTGMTKEVDRCRKAIELASQGKKVAVVSSGDAGIYGMAGLVYELLRVQDSRFKIQGSRHDEKKRTCNLQLATCNLTIEVIPGVPAFCAAASLLGAPLMHDFASISLSDLLTAWETIKKRLKAAAEGDFVIILYNPKSKTRVFQLKEAIDIIATQRSNSTPVGIVKNATRDGEEIKITALKELPAHYDFIDMTTIVIIGNSATFISDSKMITPRGYNV
ncbi:MAG: precorrin-3B C(17)-methyltransferase [Deltaproteobacteria bacterium]|nr:precorrin-3B C(17)-methyltransferase [Deltaproteobacteria bacterium]